MPKENQLPVKRFVTSDNSKTSAMFQKPEIKPAKKVEKNTRKIEKKTGSLKPIKNLINKKKAAVNAVNSNPKVVQNDSNGKLESNSVSVTKSRFSNIEANPISLMMLFLLFILLPLAIYFFRDNKLTLWVESLNPSNSTKVIVKKPLIGFENNIYDFGKIKQEQTVSTIFKFTNHGNIDLLIDKVDSTCGCTGAIISKKRIIPGETGEVKVSFSPMGLTGSQQKIVTVYSNDPQNPQKNLTIKAFVEAELTSFPTTSGL